MCHNKCRRQSSGNTNNDVHGTVFTASGGGSNATLSAGSVETGFRCLQPFGFRKKIEHFAKYHLRDFLELLLQVQTVNGSKKHIRLCQILVKVIIKMPETQTITLNCGLKYLLSTMTPIYWTICALDFLYALTMTLFNMSLLLSIICQLHTSLMMLIFIFLQN